MKVGVFDYDRALAPLVAARRELMGHTAASPPRFLVRVDEFPHYLSRDDPLRYGLDTAKEFHDTLALAGVPYMMAVVPEPAAMPLSPGSDRGEPMTDAEVEFLGRMGDEGVVFGQHGTTHRTRDRRPRKHSELSGLDLEALADHVDRGATILGAVGIHPEVFVPPFNRFDAVQWSSLSERYCVVCGGPESVMKLGFHRTPLFRGESVYMPSYPPYYGTAAGMLPAVERVIDSMPGTWISLVLHVGWEHDDAWHGLRRLAERIAPYTESWHEFIGMAKRVRPGRQPSAGPSGATGGGSRAQPREAGPAA